MSTMSQEAETNENKTMASLSSTKGRSTLTISKRPGITNSPSTILSNQPTRKAATDGDDEKDVTGLATYHFISIFAISLTFVSFFLNP